MKQAQHGVSLVVGLVLLSVVALLGLAGANGAHVEQLLAQNETFRENAASAASAGIEMAIRAIVNSPAPETVVPGITGELSASRSRYEASIRFIGYETGLPQAAGMQLAGAHFEIQSSGFAARNAVDHQRADIMQVIEAGMPTAAAPCEPIVMRRCWQPLELRLQSWQRIPAP